MKNNSEIITGWMLHFEEVSNNCYAIELTDKFGRQAGCTGDLEGGIMTCIGYALDIEKQVNNHIGKFLLDLFRFTISKRAINEAIFDQVDGGWTIQLGKRRFILDEKNRSLILQCEEENKSWTNGKVISVADLTFDQINKMTDLSE
jgi:hypothetical protein